MTEPTEMRVAALQFAASLRGASDDEASLSWMVGMGYAEAVEDGYGDTMIVLTEAGVNRADGIIETNPRMFA